MTMQEEYEESFYYDKQETANTTYSGIAAEVSGGIIGLLLTGVFVLITRFDLLGSGLLSALAYIIMWQNNWDKGISIAVVTGIFALTMILQHFVKLFRILLGLFTCAILAVLAAVMVEHDTKTMKYTVMVITFMISAFWGIISWKRIIGK